mmetsp:Transcript_31272/g.58304  ORF Transcript_31272/g.58304 Transcript_31272/m.58304 type:complete len:92 (+) Transcript_31272:131-406(+)
MHKKPLHCCWGDGSDILQDEIDHLRQVYLDSSVEVLLESGDAVIVDNLQWAHGRLPYEGLRKMGLIMSPLLPRQHIAAAAVCDRSRRRRVA